MAQIQTHAQVIAQRLQSARFVEPGEGHRATHGRRAMQIALEEGDDLVDGLQQAMRLGLERQRDAPPRARPQRHQVRDVTQKVLDDQGQVLRPGERGLERTGYGAQAAFDSGVLRQQGRQQICELIGVAQPLGVAPVGQVDVFLHTLAVESAVRKAVDGEDVHALAAEKVAKLGQRRGRGQLGSGTRRQAQPDTKVAIGPGGHQAVADRRDMAVEVRADFSPRLTRMDVAAVGEMDAGAQVHAPYSRRRSQTRARRISWASIWCTSSPTPMSRSSVMVSSPPRCSRNSRRPRSSCH